MHPNYFGRLLKNMGKTAQKKVSTFNAGRDEAIKMKKKRDFPTYWNVDREDGQMFCPYMPKCRVGKLWLLGWRLGWINGKSAYYKD